MDNMEDGGNVPAWVTIASGAGGAVLAGLGKWVWDRAGRNREWNKEDEKTNIQMRDDLIARIDKDRLEARQEAHSVRDELSGRITAMNVQLIQMQITIVKAIAHIKYLESALDSHNIKHMKWLEENPLVEAKP
jgi:hypothetical protein